MAPHSTLPTVYVRLPACCATALPCAKAVAVTDTAVRRVERTWDGRTCKGVGTSGTDACEAACLPSSLTRLLASFGQCMPPATGHLAPSLSPSIFLFENNLNSQSFAVFYTSPPLSSCSSPGTTFSVYHCSRLILPSITPSLPPSSPLERPPLPSPRLHSSPHPP